MRIKEFISAKSEPVNLAIFRIIIFSCLLILTSKESWTWGGSLLFRLSCFMAIAGLFTRVAIPIAAITGAYLLGIPPLFAKANHYSHLIWFLVILSVGRCADILSVDSIVNAWKRADHGGISAPGPSNTYALPLKVIGILIGGMFIIPGFAKIWNAGFEGIFSGDIKFQRYNLINLQLLFVILVNWSRVFKIMGQYLFCRDCYIIYDGACTLCRRTMAALQVFDIFNRVKYLNAYDTDSLKKEKLDHLDAPSLTKDVHVVADNCVWKGFHAYRILALRIPALWIVWPLLYVWPVTAVGQRIYRVIADSRLCQIAISPPIDTSANSEKTMNSQDSEWQEN